MVAIYITPPCTRGKSLELILSTISLPMPGIAKTVSISMEPVRILPRSVPATVTIGISAFRKACPMITLHLFRPLASAVRI